jgi:peptidylprolyl isomerase
MKLRVLAACTLAALALTAGAASAQDISTDKGKMSYALGYRAGGEIAQVMSSGEQLDMATVMKAFQDSIGNKQPAITPEQAAPVMQALQSRIVAKAKSELEKRAADNKAKGDAFLAQNKGKPGVKVLPDGVQYRVIEAGSGAKPTQANQITVEFVTKLPDGTEVENTNKAINGQAPGPVTIRLSEIPMPGLREALQMMPAGARWEVALPGSAAYGTSVERSGRMANQALIFDIKLLSVGPVLPAPSAAPPTAGQN